MQGKQDMYISFDQIVHQPVQCNEPDNSHLSLQVRPLASSIEDPQVS